MLDWAVSKRLGSEKKINKQTEKQIIILVNPYFPLHCIPVMGSLFRPI